MKRNILTGALALIAGSLIAADSSPKDEVTAAAKKLADKPNYSWKQTTVVPESAQFKPGPTEGKIEKDGFTHLSSVFGENTTQTLLKGDKGAVTNRDGEWQGLADVEKEEGFRRFRAIMARNFKTPAAQAAELAAGAKDLKKDGDAYSGELTEDGAKAQLRFVPTTEVSNAKGSVKFWIKEGVLSKYEIKLKGTVKFGDNEVDQDQIRTVEIKDVGTTKVNPPEEAKKKLS